MTNPKSYTRPTTLLEAARLAAQPDALALAGGGLLLGTLDLPYPHVVDLQNIAELRKIESVSGGYSVGGTVMLAQIAELPGLHPTLQRALTRALPLNMRSGISVMESFQALDAELMREWLAALTVLDAMTHWVTADGVTVTYNMAELLAHHEAGSGLPGLLRQLDLGMYAGYRQALGAAYVARTPSDTPIVNAAVYIRLDAENTPDIAFAAVCGASTAPVTMVGLAVEPDQTFTSADVRRLASAVEQQVDPVGDWRGSADYRRAMARVCVERALAECQAQLST